ncbi:MAG: HD domain-containing protein [Candidatus Micrarchaeota archaeon]
MPKSKPNYKNIGNFLFEIGDLKRIRRSGWWHVKIDDPESVAEHSFRVAIIAYALARLEKSSTPEKIAFAALIHDLPESRLLDLHKISKSYVKNKHEIEAKISIEQQEMLGFSFPVLSIREKTIVKDADLLEMAFTAREYSKKGFPQADLLFTEAKKKIILPASKKLLNAMEKLSPNEWWKSIEGTGKK